MKLVAKARTRIYGSHDSWSLSSIRGHPSDGIECDVDLEISSDGDHAFLLIQAPHGFFVADDWFASKEEALKTATECFGVSADEWRIVQNNKAPG
jgi:hypothetical protein